MLDGAVVSGNYKNPIKVPTMLHCNNPVVLELCRRHGRDLNFIGVILSRGHHDTHMLKERSAQYAAKLASLIGADGVILTMEGSGNTTIDFMQTVKACEQRGVKTVAWTAETRRWWTAYSKLMRSSALVEWIACFTCRLRAG